MPIFMWYVWYVYVWKSGKGDGIWVICPHCAIHTQLTHADVTSPIHTQLTHADVTSRDTDGTMMRTASMTARRPPEAMEEGWWRERWREGWRKECSSMATRQGTGPLVASNLARLLPFSRSTVGQLTYKQDLPSLPIRLNSPA
jgi:hypothetical protein